MKIEIAAGVTIYQATRDAKNAAQRMGHSLEFSFNGIEMTVDPCSHPPDIVTIYNLKHDLRRAKAGYRDD